MELRDSNETIKKEASAIKKYFPQNRPQRFSFQSVQVGTWEEYPSSSQNYWSENIYRMLSISTQEEVAPGLSLVQQNISNPDKNFFIELLVGIKNKSLTSYQTLVFRYKGSDSVSKTILLTCEPVKGNSGEVEFWRGTMQDISTSTLLEDSYNRFADNTLNFIDTFPLLMAFVNTQGLISFWNKALEDLTGYKASEIAENRELLKEIISCPASRRKLRFHEQQKKTTTEKNEIQVISKKGVRSTIEYIMFRFSTGNDTWKNVLVGKNVTVEKQTIKDLHTKSTQLEVMSTLAVELLSLPMEENHFHHLGLKLEKFVPNCFFVVSSIDQEFMTVEGVYGFTPNEWQLALETVGWNPVGRRFQYNGKDLLKSDDSDFKLIEKSLYEFSEGEISSVASRSIERSFSIQQLYSTSIQSGGRVYGSVFFFARKELVMTNFQLAQEIVSLYALAFDRLKVEEDLLGAKSREEESNKFKTAYMANLGHEIRTPMNAILGFTQLLTQPSLPKELKKQYIDIINSKGKALLKLVNDMVDMSKAETGKLTVVKSEFYLNKLMVSLEEFYRIERVFQQREAIDIRLEIPEGSEKIKVFSDEGRLEQVFTNLIDNALKFTERGSITIGYNSRDDEIEFYVKDTGIGIDSILHKAIFDRFQQIGGNIVRAKGGKGLGLAISKEIVELLGGRIWVESEPDHGAEFKFTISNIQPEEPQAIDEELASGGEVVLNWKDRVILVVDDEEINYLYVSELLEFTGVKFIWARDGVQAVELVQSIKNIDVILMDIRMPRKDGYAASLEIRQINPSIPIIAQTAYAFSEDRAKAEAAGCNAYITKPINSSELMILLDSYLA